MSFSLTVTLIFFVIFTVSGLPLAFAMGLSSIPYFIINGLSFSTIVHRFFTGIDVFVYMAIPLFIFAGLIMGKSKITDAIIDFSNIIIGRFRGGLAQVVVIASMFFGGCTGAALSEVASLGTILIPAMKKEGYNEGFSAAVVVSASLQGPIIPPSLPMVIFGAITGTSVGALLIGGLIPGVLLGIANMLVAFIISEKRKYPKNDTKYTFLEIVKISRKAFLALFMPLIIMGGIMSGIFTPTEAAAVAVGYAIIIGVIFLRTINFNKLFIIGGEVAMRSAAILFLIGTAGIFGWILALENVPNMILNTITSITQNPYITLLIINIILLLWGMVMDVTPALLLLAPIFTPLVTSLGINSVHFGVVMVFNLMIGLMTPPYGTCLFTATAICDAKIGEIIKESVPFIIINIVVLFIVTYFPVVVLFLPRAVGLID
jgi:tripartite ATP-independent transporter DctM subunit